MFGRRKGRPLGRPFGEVESAEPDILKGDRMKKKRIVLVASLLLFGCFSAFCASGRFFDARPERALPRLAVKTPYLLIKAEEPAGTEERLLSVLGFLRSVVPSEARTLSELFEEMGDVFDLMGMSGPMAFLFTPKTTSRFHVAFYPEKTEKTGRKSFADFIETLDETLYEVKTWKSEASGEGWIVRRRVPFSFGAGENACIYVSRRVESGRELIFAAENESGVEAMTSAWRSRASRIKIKRYNKGPAYMQIGFPLEALRSDRSGDVVFEAALQTDEKSAHVQLYTNFLSLLGGRVTPKSGVKGKKLPLLGRGELSFVFSLDLPFASFVLYPDAPDPVERVLRKMGLPLSSELAQNLRGIMERGRISAVVTSPHDAESLGTGYCVVESPDEGALKSLLAFLAKSCEPVELRGWKEAYTISPKAGVQLLLARQDGLLLAGIGPLEDYGKNAAIPDAIKGFAAPRELCNLVATSALLDKVAERVKRDFKDEIESMGFGWLVPAEIERSGDYALQLRVITAERANLGLYKNDGGD